MIRSSSARSKLVTQSLCAPGVPHMTEVCRLRHHHCSLPESALVHFWEPSLHEDNSRPPRQKLLAGTPALLPTFRTTYFIGKSEGLRCSQQQLRLGSEGCLRSLKPLPPDGGLVSVDGILRLISIKSSFMFIAFFALVSTKIAWMESA